ncbi:MAG: response regulator [Bacillota bacterium]
MIKLMIVDDEHIVIESLKFIIEKHVNDVEIVGTANTGREAIEKAMYLKPDVIFMDIRMPGINGIDAIRQIKETKNDAFFVIVTAYEYFNYAKEAVNLGVHEYLLKPLNKSKVIETLNNIREMVVSKRQAIQREMLLKEKINKIIPHMEGQFIYSQLFNGRVIRDIDFYEEIFGISLQNGYVVMAIVEDRDTDEREESLKDSLAKQKFYDLFSYELKELSACLIGPPLLDRVVAYIPVDSNIDGYEIRNKSIDIAAKVSERINQSMDIRYRIGVGRSYNIHNFSKSCNEAYMAASVYNDELVIHFEDIAFPQRKIDSYPANKEKILTHKMLTGDTRGALEVFEEIFWWLSENYRDDLDKIKSHLIELLIVIKRGVPVEITENDVFEKHYLIEMLKIHDVVELRSSYLNYLKTFMTNIEEFRQQELSGLISQAIKYIHEKYHENISLDDVAKEMNMSYHYFSKFFKESVGKNFVDYLTDLRIEKSKEMLKDPAISVKEICYEIGYSDPNYFSKIFKKVTGMTPTEYRTNLVSQEVI